MAVEIATGIIALVPAKAPGFDGDLRRKFKDVKADVPLSADVPKFTADVTGKLRADKGSYTKAGKDIGEHIGDGMKAGAGKSSKSGGGLLAGLGGMLAGGAIITAGVESFKAYTDQTEAAGKAQIVFGDSVGVVNAQVENSAKLLGMSKLQALDAAGGFGALFRAMSVGEPQSAEMSTTLTQLAADLGAFYNTSADDATLALKSGLVGESEPLRRFGVNLNEARISAEALRLGLVKGNVNMVDVQAKQVAVSKAQQNLNDLQKSGKFTATELAAAQSAVATAEQALAEEMAGKVAPLDAAAKSQAAYSLIMQDSALAQGNFAATADNAAQKSKTAAAEFEDMKATFGEVIAPVGTAFLGWAITGLESVKTWWTENGPGIKQWFTDVFGKDPGANFSAGIDIVKGKLQEVVDWWKTNVGTWDDFKRGLDDIFGGNGTGKAGADRVTAKAAEASGFLDSVKNFVNNPAVMALNPLAGAGTAIGQLLRFFTGGFDTGGVVDAPNGAGRMAWVHGGETILPTHRMGIGDALTSVTGYTPAPAPGYGAPIVIENLHVGPGDSRTRATDVVHELRGLGLRTRGGS